MNYTVMTVDGFRIDPDIQRAAVDAFLQQIRTQGGQKASDMQALLEKNGVAADPAYRAADRLLQKMRQARLVVWSSSRGWIIRETAGEA